MIYILSCIVHKFFFLAGIVHQHLDLAFSARMTTDWPPMRPTI
jgi:hypothetical protein